MKLSMRLFTFLIIPAFLFVLLPHAEASSTGYEKASKYMIAKKHTKKHSKKVAKKESRKHSQKRQVASTKHKKHGKHKKKKHKNY